MPAHFQKVLKEEKIQRVRTRVPVIIERGSTIQQAIDAMQKQRRGCAIIKDKKKVVGIFTERDVLTRVIASQIDLKASIEKVMTPNPTCLNWETNLAEALGLMSGKGYRNLPLVDTDGEIRGLITVRDIVDFLAEHFPYEVYNLPPDPHQINRAREGA